MPNTRRRRQAVPTIPVFSIDITPFFHKQSIFGPRPENCLSFPKISPQKIV